MTAPKKTKKKVTKLVHKKAPVKKRVVHKTAEQKPSPRTTELQNSLNNIIPGVSGVPPTAQDQQASQPTNVPESPQNSSSAPLPTPQLTETPNPAQPIISTSLPPEVPTPSLTQEFHAPTETLSQPAQAPTLPQDTPLQETVQTQTPPPLYAPSQQPTASLQTRLENTSPQAEIVREKPKHTMLFIIIGLLCAIGAFGGVFYTFGMKQSPQTALNSMIKLEPSLAPTATVAVQPTPTFSQDDWSLEVLNGSGIPGAAKKLADSLAEKGYIIVKTDNAAGGPYPRTQLYVQEAAQSSASALMKDLQKSLSVSTVSGILKDSSATARIIIGQAQ